MPGRKTDVAEAQWLCRLLEAGLLRPSLVPPAPIRAVRSLTRYRKTQVKERQREAQRLQKTLEDAGIKLDCVATDVLGKSGRDMPGALCEGTTDPIVLAELARGRLGAKIPQLRETLEGRFDGDHALLVSQILAHVEFLEEAIERLSEEIAERLRPSEPALELLETIPGVGRRTAEVLIAETGGDMSAFASARHLASWAGMCPGNDESAGKRRSGKTRKGSKWLRAALCESAHAAARTRDTYLAAQFWRLSRRIGKKKAAMAVGHSILVAAWHILATDTDYDDLGGDWFARKVNDGHRRDQAIRNLHDLGYRVTLERVA